MTPPAATRLEPRADARHARVGVALVVLGAALWGAAGPIAQTLNQRYGMGPLEIAFLRLALPLPFLALAGRWIEGRWPGQDLLGQPRAIYRALLTPLLGAGLGLGLFQVLFFAGVAAVGGGPATLIAICLCPITTALLAGIVLRERLTAARVLALALALGGVGLLIAEPPGAPPGNALLGGLLAATASLAFALLAVSSRAVQTRTTPLATVTLAFLIGAIVIAPIGFVEMTGTTEAAEVQPAAFALIGFLALGPTALGYVLFFRGARRIPATATGILVLAEPAAASLLAWVAFDDRFTLTGAVGAALLGIAVVLVARQR